MPGPDLVPQLTILLNGLRPEYAVCAACGEWRAVAMTVGDDPDEAPEPLCGECATQDLQKCDGCGGWSDDLRGPDDGMNYCPDCREAGDYGYGDWHGVQVR